jgi:hypothetical protein
MPITKQTGKEGNILTSLWTGDREQEAIAKHGLALLDKEHHLGKYNFSSRADIHERKSESRQKNI